MIVPTDNLGDGDEEEEEGAQGIVTPQANLSYEISGLHPSYFEGRKRRLDQVLTHHCAERAELAPYGLSRNRLQQLIEQGEVIVDGKINSNPSAKIAYDQHITITIPQAKPIALEPEAIPLTILYEDDQIIVIDKPAGLVVHPSPGHWQGTLVHALLAHCGPSLSGVGGEMRPGIVHRLDRFTSGVMVAAKTQAAYQGLQSQFASHNLDREYLAIALGIPGLSQGMSQGRIETNLGRHPHDRQRMAVIPSPSGRSAITNWQRLGNLANGQASLILCRLETGRTHQIRLHLSHLGHPLIGDSLYSQGRAIRLANAKLPHEAREFPRQALHAYRLGFRHPQSGAILQFTSPPPEDFQNLLSCLGGSDYQNYLLKAGKFGKG